MTHTRIMCAGHAAFDERVAEIVEHAHRDEWAQLDAAWETFADDLTNHLAYEEREIFDDYEDESSAHVSAAVQLRSDHARLRDLLDRISAEIARRLLDAASIEVFVGELRQHAAREEATIYPWLEQRRGTQNRRRAREQG